MFLLYFLSFLLYFWTEKTKVRKKEGDSLFFKGNNQDSVKLGSFPVQEKTGHL